MFDHPIDNRQLKPTDHQLAIARNLGLDVQPGMTLDQVSRMIQRARTNSAPSRSQLQRARQLGIHVTPTMSTNEVRELINQANDSGPFTEQQLAEARALGIPVRDEMSYAEVEAMIHEAEMRNPSYEKKRELCQRIGLPVKPGMKPEQIDRLLDYARSNPRYAEKLNAFDPARVDELDRKQRQLYGDELVDELVKWKRQIGQGQFLVIFGLDGKCQVDVAVFESARIMGSDEPQILLEISLPLVVSDEDGIDYLEWANDQALSPAEFHLVTRLKSRLDEYGLDEYGKLLEHGRSLAREFRHNGGNRIAESNGQ